MTDQGFKQQQQMLLQDQLLEEKFQGSQNIIPVVLCNQQGEYVDANDKRVDATVPNDRAYVFAREFGESQPAQYLNVRGIEPVGGMPCLAGYSPESFEMEILATFDQTRGSFERQTLGRRHAHEHEPGGYDPLNVYLSMLVPLRVSPVVGLSVQVAPFVYDMNDGTIETFIGTALDLTDFVPATAGKAKYILIYLDPEDNLIKVVEGSEAADVPTIPPPFPDPVQNTYPSAWVRLANGQTSINPVTDIVHCRLLYSRFDPISKGGWPFENVLTVHPTDPEADFDTIQDAVLAASTGYAIMVAPGTYNEQVTILTAGITIFAAGGLGSVQITTDELFTVGIAANNVRLVNLDIVCTSTSVLSTPVIVSSGTGIHLENVKATTAGAATAGYAFYFTGTGTSVELFNCTGSASGATISYGLSVTGTSGLIVKDRDGVYNGTNGDVVRGTGVTTLDLRGTKLENGPASGITSGFYSTGGEILLPADGIITIDESSTKPSTPATANWSIYFKSTGGFYEDDAGTEYGPLHMDINAYTSLLLGLPGLRGLWTMGAMGGNAEALDILGNLHLTNTGNADFGYDTVAPYVDFDGSTQYFTHADAAGFDITGGEAYVGSATQGLTMGCWVNLDAIGNNNNVMGKGDTTNAGSSYLLRQQTGSNAINAIVFNGSTAYVATNTNIATTTWQFFGLRFVPSSQVRCYCGDASQGLTTVTSTTSIPATINNSSAPFNIGAENNGAAGSFSNGRISNAFLCGQALSDAMMQRIFDWGVQIYS